uniref:Transmembrane protein n=1 Tax=Fagus sylvatica TaxID=28930 RepID=A0A2N9J207_FAGSY
MDAKTSMRIIIIPMLLFLFLSSAMVVAEPYNVVPRAKKNRSLRDILTANKAVPPVSPGSAKPYFHHHG